MYRPRPKRAPSPRRASAGARCAAARRGSRFCGLAGSTSISTLNSPVGCSTEMVFTFWPGTTAMPCVIEPSSTQAVATVTAASTPMASWQTCGMKLRVLMAPPARGGGDQRHLRVILARHVAKLHRVPAGDAQPLDPRLQLGIGVQLIDALIAGAADIGGLEDHQRHAVVDAGHGDAVDHVADMAGRQQSRRRPSPRYRES